MSTLNPFRMVLAFALGLSLASGPSVHAQSTADTLQPALLSPDATDLVSAIASYSEDVRQAALKATQHPDVLTQLVQQQQRSQQAFAGLIQRYGKTKQSWFYDLARFPAAQHALAQLPRKAREQGRALIQTLPLESQTSAWKLFRHHHPELTQADSMSQQAESRFDSLITPLAPPTQRAFRELLAQPELLSLLTQPITATTRLGVAYQTDSVGMARQLTRLHDSIERQNQRELAEYTRGLGDDGLARQELQLAGEAYAQARGYPAGYSLNPAPADSSGFYDQPPYLFWFGYPTWYHDPLWYASTRWYGTGYGYDPAGHLTVLGFPSPGFLDWFFTSGFRAYPHLDERFRVYSDRTTSGQRYWTPRNSGLLLATRRQFGSRLDEGTAWTGHGHGFGRPWRLARTINVTGSNVSIWTSSPTRHYRPARSYRASSYRWSVSTRTPAWGRSHHSGSAPRGSYHGGSSRSRGPR